MPLGHWLKIQLKKVLTSLLWEMKKVVKTLIAFFFFSNSMFWQLLWEFAHFCSAIRTKIDPITYEQLSIMLQSEEQAMAKNFDNLSHSLAMYAYGNKHSNNS